MTGRTDMEEAKRYKTVTLASIETETGAKRQDTQLSRLSAVVLCATIVSTVLFSGMVGGNTVNFAVTAAFVAVAVGTAIIERRAVRFYPEITILMVWLFYSMLASASAIALEPAIERTQQMLQIMLLVLVALNVIVWNQNVGLYMLVYFLACIVAYFGSLTGFGFGVVDQTVLQELNSADRFVGTQSNANKFGTLMVYGQLASLLFAVQIDHRHAKLLAALAITILGIAVLHSGSRTALIGMAVAIFGMIWIFKVWRFDRLLRAAAVLLALGVFTFGTYLIVKDNELVRARIDSYLANEQLMSRYENLFRLVTSFGQIESIDNSVEGSASDRAQLATKAWNAAMRRPFGLGLDNFAEEYGKYAHSNYFELLATTGFPGLAIFLLIYGSLLRKVLLPGNIDEQASRIARAVGVSIFSLMVMDVAHVSYFSKPYWLFMAIVIYSADRNQRINSTRNRQIRSLLPKLISDRAA